MVAVIQSCRDGTWGVNCFEDPTDSNDAFKSNTGNRRRSVCLIVDIADVDEVPVVVGDSSVAVDESVAVSTAVADLWCADPEVQDVTWSIVSGGGSLFSLSSTSAVTSNTSVTLDVASALDAETATSHTVVLSCTDGTTTATQHTVTVTVNDVNDNNPTVPADQSPTVTENTAAGTVASVACSDADASASLNWSLATSPAGGPFSISNTGPHASGVSVDLQTTAALDYEVETAWTVTMTCTDGDNSADHVVNVAVGDVNEAPVISGATSGSINENTAGTTNVATGLVCTDPEGSASLAWSVTSPGSGFGMSAATAASGTGVNLQATAPLDHETTATQAVTVQCSDGTNSVSHGVTVTVNDVNEAPTFTAGDTAVTIGEDTAAGTSIVTNFACNDVDDSDTLTWAVQSTTPGSGPFDMTGDDLRTTAALDHEGVASYDVVVRCRDSGSLDATRTVTVTISDVDEPPVITGTSTASINENTAGTTALVSDLVCTDPEGEANLDWAVQGTTPGGGPFSLSTAQANSGVAVTLRATAAMDHETTPSYTVTLSCSDRDTTVATFAVTVTVGDVNEAPTFTAGDTAVTIGEDTAAGTSIVTNFACNDVDDSDTLTWAVQSTTPGSGPFDMTGDDLRTTAALDHESVASYDVVVRCRDSGSLDATRTVTVTISDVDEPPVITGTSTASINENTAGTTALVSDLVCTDPEGEANLDWAVQGTTPGGGPFSLSTAQANSGVAVTLRATAAMDHETTPSYTVTLSCSDRDTTVATFAVTVTVGDVDETPTYTGTTSLTVAEDQTTGATVTGAVTATDVDGDTLTWSLVPASVPFRLGSTSAYTNALEVDGPLDFETTTSYSFTIRITQGSFTVDTPVTVTVTNVDEPPVINTATLSVNENVATGVNVGSAITAFEPEGQTITWSIDAVNDGAAFAIDSSTGQITTAVSTFDHETKATYTIRVRATDTAANAGTRVFTIAVNDLPEDPAVDDATTDVDENRLLNHLVFTCSFRDDDSVAGMAFAITAGNDEGYFSINSAAEIRMARVPLNYEEFTQFVLTVQATDNTARTGTATITIDVNDVNEAPTIVPGQVFNLDEAAYNGELVGPLIQWFDVDNDTSVDFTLTGGNTGGLFSVSSAGQLEISDNSTLDFETTASYTLQFSIVDVGPAIGPPRTRTDGTVTVNILDVNDIPQLADRALSIDENSADGTALNTASPLSATDEDGGAGNANPFTYHIANGQDAGGRFVVSTAGVVAVAPGGGALLDHETNAAHSIQVRAQDAGGEYSVPATVTITVNDINEAPVVVDQSVSINENVLVNAAATPVVVYSDEDAADSHACSLIAPRDDEDPLDPGNFLFRVNSTSCQIERDSVYKINHEHNGGSYSVTVQVQDNGGPSNLAGTAVITVNVIDQPEPPRWVNRLGHYNPRTPDAPYVDYASVLEVAPAGTQLFDLFAFDEDAGQNASVTYSLVSSVPPSGTSYFDVSAADGFITTTQAGHENLSFEERIVYNLTVRADDNNGQTTDGEIRVHVTDVEEAPAFVNDTRYVLENAPVGWQLQSNISLPTSYGLSNGDPMEHTDPDDGAVVTFTILAGNDEGVLRLNAGNSAMLEVDPVPLIVDYERTRNYSLYMRAQDETGRAGWGELIVHVVDCNDNPVPTSPTTAAVLEHTPSGTVVYTATYTDEDGDTAVWSEVSGDTAGMFTVAASGAVSLTRNIDFEVDPKWTLLELQVDDNNLGGKPEPPWGLGIATMTVNISIIDENDRPVMPPATFAADENTPPGTFIGLAAASDQDLQLGGQSLTWSIIGGHAKSVTLFRIDNTTGNIYTDDSVSPLPGHFSSLDYENQTSHSLLVRVIDDGTNSAPLFQDATFTINLNDVNEPAEVGLQRLFVSENPNLGAQANYNASGCRWWGTETSALRSPWHVRQLGLQGSPEIVQAMIKSYNESHPAGDAFSFADPDAPAQTIDIDLFLLSGTGYDHTPDVVYPLNVGGMQRTTSYTSASYPAPVGQALGPLSRGYFGAGGNVSLPRGLHKTTPIPPAAFAFDKAARTITLVNGTLDAEATPVLQFLVRVSDDGAGLGGVPAVAHYILNVEVVDVNEAATLDIVTPGGAGQATMNENAPLADVIDDTFLRIRDEDAQPLHTEWSEGVATRYFNVTPFVSTRDVNGSRESATFIINRPLLPSGVRLFTVQTVDYSDSRFNSLERTFILSIADVNDAPALPDLPGLTVLENSPTGTVIAEIAADDADYYQNLRYEVQGNLAPYFKMVQLQDDIRLLYPDTYSENPVRRNTSREVLDRFDEPRFGGNITRRAQLVVLQDSIDYESMQHSAVNGVFEITVRVTDEHYVAEEGEFVEPTYGNPDPTDDSPSPNSVDKTYTVTVLDVLDPPIITNVSTISPFGLTTAGGEEVTIRGLNLGSEYDPHPGVTKHVEAIYNSSTTGATFEGVNCRVTESYTEVKCSTSPGYGADYRWQLALGGYVTENGQLQQLSPMSEDLVTYASPNVVEFTGPGAQGALTAGQQTIRIRGSQFGLKSADKIDSVTYGPTGREYNATNCSVVIDHSTIECTTSEGVGEGLRWVVVIAGLSSQTPTTSYAAPQIQQVSVGGRFSRRLQAISAYSNASTAGGDTLILRGTNFGAVDERPAQINLVQYGLPQYADETLDPNEPVDQDCSLPRPNITVNTELNPSLDMVLTATKCRVTVDHVEVQCSIAAGMGANLHVQMTVRGQRSFVSNSSFSYAAPSIDAVHRLGNVADSTGNTAGTTAMVLRGQNFGRSTALTTVYFGQRMFDLATGAPLGVPGDRPLSQSVVGTHTQRDFTAPQGHGTNVSVSVETQCQRSADIDTFSYSPPFITALRHLSGGLANPPIRIAVEGNNFGGCCYRQRLLAAAVADGSRTPPLTTAEQADLDCQCVPGLAESIGIEEIGGGRVYGCDITAYSDTEAICTVEFSSNTDPNNETTVDTILHGTLRMQAGGQDSNTALYRYSSLLQQPQINEVVPAVIPTVGMPEVQVRGLNFGSLRENVDILYRRPNGSLVVVPIPSFQITHWSDTLVNFTMPAGQGSPIIRLSFSGTTQEDRFDAVSFQQPSVTSVNTLSGFSNGFVHRQTPDNPNVRNGDRVEAPKVVITGSNFGANSIVHWESAFASGNGFPPDRSASHEFQGGLLARTMWPFSDPADGVPTNFPDLRSENFVLIGGKQCAIEEWTHTQIVCRAPPGTGAVNEISLNIHSRRGQNLAADVWRRTVLSSCVDQSSGDPNPTTCVYSYFAPSIQSLRYIDVPGESVRGYSVPSGSNSYGPTTGSALVEILGTSFGAATPPALSIAGAATINTADIESFGHSRIRFRTPSGQGRELALTVTVNQQSAVANIFAYDPPVVLEVAETESVAVEPGQNVNANFSSTTQGLLRFNAKGSTLAIRGRNFGDEQVQPTVTVGSTACSYSSHSQNLVLCRVTDTTVGPKSVRVNAAGQATTLPQESSNVFGECRSGEFGVLHGIDRCFACPTCFEASCDALDPDDDPASECTGGTAPPVAARGFWRLQRSQLQAGNALIGAGSDDELSEYAAAKQAEFYEELAASLNGTDGDVASSKFEYIFTRCEPPQGCIGNNLCAEGYSGPACSICVAGTHQRDLITGGCTPCPDAPELYMVGMLVGVMIVGFILFKLYKKGPSVAALGIAVDYFQVLSVFGTLNLEWPASVVFVFRVASASAASVEVTSPECSVSMTYNQKWYFQMAIPLVAIIALGLAHCVFVLHTWLKYRNKHVDNVSYTKHLPAMIGFLFMLFSFLYISLCGKAFEVLRCTSVGGRPVLVVDTEVACEGSDYERISWWARTAIFSYGIGIPALFALVLLKSSQKMKVDQALRIRNLAGSRDTNPYFDMQKRFKRLYFKFKPEYYYWLLVLLARKFLIVLCSALLYNKPMLAATSSVLILFAAYSLQIMFKPYRGHQEQSKEEAVASGQLGDEIPQAVLDRVRQEMQANTAKGAKGGEAAGTAASPQVSPLHGAKAAVVAPVEGGSSAPAPPKASKSVLNPLNAPSSPGRKQNPKALVDLCKRGVDLDDLVKDRSLLMANDPRNVLQTSAQAGQSSRKSVGRFFSSSSSVLNSPSKKDMLKQRKMSTRTLAMHNKGGTGGSNRNNAPVAGTAAGVRQGSSGGFFAIVCGPKRTGPKQATRCCGLCPAKGASVEGLGLREEARKGGKTKIKVKYLYDYNLLETTFLCCGLFVLLAGVMFKSADATGEVPAGSGESKILEGVVITIVIGSTIVCFVTVFAELFLGLKYFVWAGEIRRRREKEEKRRAILEGRKVQLSKDQKALLMWSKFVYMLPKPCRRHCGPCCKVPAPAIITGAAYKATIMKVAKGNTKETAAIKVVQKDKKPKRGRRNTRAASILGRSKRRISLGGESDESESESDTERQKREEAQKLADNARSIIKAAKPQGRRVQGLGVVENATPREFAHLTTQEKTSIHDSSVRREAVLARLRAATKAKGHLPPGFVAPTSAADEDKAAPLPTKSSRRQTLVDNEATQKLHETSTDAVKAEEAAMRAAHAEAEMAQRLGLQAATVTRAVNSATAAGILRAQGDDFLMSAAKKKKKVAIARYVVSIHLGQITRLTDDRIKPGQPLRLTIKTGLESEKFTMPYKPLQDMRQREVRLLIFDPAEDTVHCTLYADFKREGNVSQHELVLGYLHFRTSELPDPSENRRVERSFSLVQYNGTVSGAMTLLIRLQHRGAAVDDWVELGMGSKTSRVPDHSRGMFNRGPRAEALQGSGAPSELDGAPMGRPKIEADLGGKGTFQAHNPLNHPAARGESDSDSKSMRSTLTLREGSDSDSGRRLLQGGGGRVSSFDAAADSDGSSRAAMLAGAAGGAFANTRRGKAAAAALAAANASGDEGARESARDSLRVATAVRHPAFSARQDTTTVGAGTAAGAATQGDFAVGNPLSRASAPPAAAAGTGGTSRRGSDNSDSSGAAPGSGSAR